MKGLLRIGGAVLVGIVLVLGAFYASQQKTPIEQGAVVVVQAPERNPIDAVDSDNNGVADWKESFDGVVFETIQTPPQENSVAEKYVPPSTLTGKFSIALYTDYLDTKSTEGTVNQEALVGNAIQAIDRSTKAKKHSRLEFKIIESTQETLRTYGNDLVNIVISHPLEGEADTTILKEALEKDDPAVLQKLVPIIDAYQSTINDMLEMDVPSELAAKHLELVNGYEAVLANITSMQKVLDDPLYTLARIRNYGKDGRAVIDVVKSISKQLTNSGITYSNEELGSGFYYFDI